MANDYLLMALLILGIVFSMPLFDMFAYGKTYKECLKDLMQFKFKDKS